MPIEKGWWLSCLLSLQNVNSIILVLISETESLHQVLMRFLLQGIFFFNSKVLSCVEFWYLYVKESSAISPVAFFSDKYDTH